MYKLSKMLLRNLSTLNRVQRKSLIQSNTEMAKLLNDVKISSLEKQLEVQRESATEQLKLLQKIVALQSETLGFREAEILSLKHKLHCRGVIERFEYTHSTRLALNSNVSRTKTWTSLLDDYNLEQELAVIFQISAELPVSDQTLQNKRGSTPISTVRSAIVNRITNLYARLSQDIHRDPSGQRQCLIDSTYLDKCEVEFIIYLCKKIPVAYEVYS